MTLWWYPYIRVSFADIFDVVVAFTRRFMNANFIRSDLEWQVACTHTGTMTFLGLEIQFKLQTLTNQHISNIDGEAVKTVTTTQVSIGTI